MERANVNTVEHMQPIYNEVTNSAFLTTKGSRHAGTSFSNQPKRRHENIQAISVASEDALSKRIRDPTAIVGNRRPRRVTYGSEEGCNSSHNGGKRLFNTLL
nr:hypothetical protein [Tanacetum cinerariifolium]